MEFETRRRRPDLRGRILVVDDDAGLRDALVEALASKGFEAWSACDGIDAFEVLEERGVPDLVVLDLDMPGMNGWEFLEEVRDNTSLQHLPVVVVTGAGNAAPKEADVFFVKPVPLDVILRSVVDEIDSSASHARG